MVLKSIILLGCCLVIAASSAIDVSPSDSLLSHWSAFKAQHGKHYASAAEEAKRFEIFAKNKLEVDRFNAEESEKAGYRQGLNQFSDMTKEEVLGPRARMQSAPTSRSAAQVDHEYLAKLLEDDGEPLPAEVDWRKEGRVSWVKTEGECSSAYAFAAAGVLEGQQKVVKNISNVIDLSVQQLVDCGGDGCDGSLMENGFRMAIREKGIMPDEDYPYRARRGLKCKLDPSNIVISPKNFTVLEPKNDELNLQRVVAKYGPVAAQIDNWWDSFLHYLGGVYSDKDCGFAISYNVLVVGYGTDPKEGDYWIIKLNWGRYWGEGGYMRLKRGVNLCQIAWQPMIFTF